MFLKSQQEFDFKVYNYFDEEALNQIPISNQYAREITSKEVSCGLAGTWIYRNWKKNFSRKYGSENFLI